MSSSKKNVLRGLHFQSKNSQAKIITVGHEFVSNGDTVNYIIEGIVK